MRKYFKKIMCVAITCALVVPVMLPQTAKKAEAINPVVQDVYTADPAPMVCSDGRLYLFSSHDEDVTVNGFFSMNDWKCYSTTDMVNWTDHGTALSYHTFSWAKDNSSWAPQVVERDGKFYAYVPINNKNNTNCIGVAVADSPEGPYEDPIGKPLLGPTYSFIDPTAFVDEDGQAYIYWGNPNLHCALLNDDMISIDTSINGDGFVNGIKKWNMETSHYSELNNVNNNNNNIASGNYKNSVSAALKDMHAQFGVGTRVDNNKVRRPTMYEEGPWFYGRTNDKGEKWYYMIYAANGIPERIDYSMSQSPTGPWQYKGMIMDDNVNGQGTGSFTNHPGIVDYKGHSYLFYHTGKLVDGGGFKRSVAIEEITYNEDGTINAVPFTDAGVDPIEALNPYDKVEAETIELSNSLNASPNDRMGKYGVEKEKKDGASGNINLYSIENNDYIKLRNVDFGEKGAIAFTACTSSSAAKDTEVGTIDIYFDSLDSEPVTWFTVKSSGNADEFVAETIDVDKSVMNGVHDVYMVFTGNAQGELFKFDYWQFEKEPEPTPAPTEVPTTEPVITPTAGPGGQQLQPTVAPSELEKPAKVKGLKIKKKGKKAVNVSWKKMDADKFEIVYGTNKKLKKSIKIKTTAKTFIKIKKLKVGKKYYFKVRAYNTNGTNNAYGPYSKKKKIKM
ncbi:MAG: carbohydrate-binding protein [Lachnospiraceae bacterium]|nr:carbohydrate-binding protein [Lachnospiraceae bacterium]